MKRYKNTSILFSFLLSGCLLLTACNNNSIKSDPDTFAKAVDKYFKSPTGWNYRPAFHVCISYYYDPKDARQLVPEKELMKDINRTCPGEFKDLAIYLNKDPIFKGITPEDLASQKVWAHYFKGKHEISNYFRM